MVWFKVDDSFYSSRKVVRIPRGKRYPAIGLWLITGTWCANNLTDGRIEQHELDELGGRKSDADALVACGLWESDGAGYQFHNWGKYQPTREEVIAAREKEAERKRRSRSGNPEAESGSRPGGLRADTLRTPDGQNAESGHPDPSRPVPTNTGGYDTQSEQVPNREGSLTDEESISELCARQAQEIYGVDFAPVRTAIAKATDTVPNPSGVMRIIAEVMGRAKPPIPKPTGLVITAVRNEWAEFQRFLHEEGLAS